MAKKNRRNITITDAHWNFCAEKSEELFGEDNRSSYISSLVQKAMLADVKQKKYRQKQNKK